MQKLTLFLLGILILACARQPELKVPRTDVRVDPAKLEISSVMGIANIEPRDRIIQLTSEASGIVQEITVAINDTLRKGQAVLLLDDKVERSQLNQAEAKLTTQLSIIDGQQSSVGSVQVRLSDAKNKYDRNQRLFQGGAATQQVLDESKFNFENLEFELQMEQNKLSEQNARLNELRSDVVYYQTLLARKSIKTPVTGTLLSMDVKVGSFIDNKVTIGDFAPAGPIIAITEIDELFANRVQIGQQAFIRLQGDTLQLARGVVILTAPYLKKKSLFSDNANNLEDRRVREVRVELTDASHVLIGSRVECVIKTN